MTGSHWPGRRSKINELSLFTGAGGGLLGSKLLGWRTLGYVEIEDYCQKVIKQRIKDGILDDAPIFGDIKTFIDQRYAESYKGMVDVVTGGPPCQPFSVAGKQNANDPRNVWPEAIKTVEIIRPTHVLFENVPGSRKYLPVVIRSLRRIGYTVKRPLILAAASMGAGHIRRRVWIYAHINEAGREDAAREPAAKEKKDVRGATDMENSETISAHAYSKGELQQEGTFENIRGRFGNGSWWETEPDLVRVVYGLPNAMDRIGMLGNAQIPAVVAAAWEILASK